VGKTLHLCMAIISLVCAKLQTETVALAEEPRAEEKQPFGLARNQQKLYGKDREFCLWSKSKGTSDANSPSEREGIGEGEICEPIRGPLVDFPGPAFPRQLEKPPTELPVRKEFQPGAVEKGEADEPEIASMGDDWSNGVEVRASIDRKEFRQLQRIRVVAEIKNVSDRHLWIPPSAGNRYLNTRVRVFDVKGKLVSMTQFYKNEGRRPEVSGMSNGSAGFSFNPKTSLHIDVIANLIFDMTRPGEYWVLFEMPVGSTFSPKPGMEGLFYARAAPIKIKVLPEPIRILPDRIDVPDPDRP
jgi:hypothetical protein